MSTHPLDEVGRNTNVLVIEFTFLFNPSHSKEYMIMSKDTVLPAWGTVLSRVRCDSHYL